MPTHPRCMEENVSIDRSVAGSRATYDEWREDVEAGGVSDRGAVHERDHERNRGGGVDRGGLHGGLDDLPDLELGLAVVDRLELAREAVDAPHDAHCRGDRSVSHGRHADDMYTCTGWRGAIMRGGTEWQHLMMLDARDMTWVKGERGR